MAPLDYLLLRTVRHFMPAAWAQWLLRRGWIIKPGLETKDPDTAAARYLDILNRNNCSLEQAEVFILGYGGHFDVGLSLLEAGAAAITFCDPFAQPDLEAAEKLAARRPGMIQVMNGELIFLDDRISLLSVDVRSIIETHRRRFALVLSSSVFEHVDSPHEIADALSMITTVDGCHIHFIDLRDHFFKYPFEMLCYDERAWKNFLNPTSNLNRCRIADFQTAFSAHFAEVEWEILSSDRAAFERTQVRIKPQYLSGNIEVDAVTRILLTARQPLSNS